MRQPDPAGREASTIAPGRFPVWARRLLQRSWEISRPLTLLGLFALVAIPFLIALVYLDPRVITGQPAWMKPLRFAISGAIYAFTAVFLLGQLQGHSRLARLIGTTIAACFLLEYSIIVVQVIRGTTSHFNVGSPLDALLWYVMAPSISAVWLATVVLAFLLARQPSTDPVLGRAMVLGLAVALCGMAVTGLLMPMPTPAQRLALAAGQQVSVIGAHSVGVPDGGPGLPITDWSTVGGDLRVPHFLSLHSLQVMLVLGWLASARSALASRLSSRQRELLMWPCALALGGLVAIATWQAERGQSVIAPDALTITALALLAGGAALWAAAIALVARRGEQVAGLAHVKR